MNRLHTAEQINGLNLPGFRNEATLDQITAPDTDWQTVLSLSIYREDPDKLDGLQVMTGVRTADTPTHGNVASTPTGRFPKAFEPGILSEKQSFILETPPVNLSKLSITETQTVASLGPNAESLPNRDSGFPFVAHEVLARKLGMAEALQNKTGREGRVGQLSLSEILAGFSWAADHPETDEPLWEPIVMYAGVVLLDNNHELPTQTTAYSDIGWTPVEDFLVGHQSRLARMVVPSLEEGAEIEVCVRGFCLNSTRAVSLKPSLGEHLGIETAPIPEPATPSVAV